MFISDTHLPNLLQREHYLEDSFHQQECERGFMPAWHLIAARADLPNEGDYLTFRLLGRSLILWRINGEYHCFLNVCSHRFCTITSKETGNFAEHIRCQYHGWEFASDGCTRKIPDAPSFKPLQKGELGLTEYAIALVGDLIFVCLAPNPQEIRSFLGPAYDLCAERCSGDWFQAWSWQPLSEANWKLANEITLEGYHTIAAHAETLGQFPLPKEANMRHGFPDERHCELDVDTSSDNHPDILRVLRVAEHLGRKRDHRYLHYHAFPHFGIIANDVYAIAQSIYPVTPTTHINLYRMFVFRGGKRDQFTEQLFQNHALALTAFWARVFEEDRFMSTEHHRGISSPELPTGGVISRREERVVHFQKYIRGLYDSIGTSR